MSLFQIKNLSFGAWKYGKTINDCAAGKAGIGV
jgi:hypothetical protein